MKSHLELLVRAALQAPSGDNLQPWKIIVDSESDTIGICLVESRDTSPMNSGQRMSRIAIGAMLENMVQLASSLGLSLDTEICPKNRESLIVLQVRGGISQENPAIDQVIMDRVSNRRVYEGNPVPDEIQKKLLEESCFVDGFKSHWVFQKDKLNQLGELIGESDACMFSAPQVRESLIGTVRFDLARHEGADEGMSLGSLEAGFSDIIGLRILRWLPDFLFRAGNGGKKFFDAAMNFITSSSGLCLITQPEIRDESDIMLGSLMQRVWLLLTRYGFAVQPMNSLVILNNMIHFNEIPSGIDRSTMASLLEKLQNHFPDSAESHPGFIFRFGYAAPPSVKNRRLPFELQVVEGRI